MKIQPVKLIVLLVIGFAITVSIAVFAAKSLSAQGKPSPRWQKGSDSIKPTGEIVEVTMIFHDMEKPVISIVSARIKRAHAPKPQKEGNFSIQLLSNSGIILSSTPFTMSSFILDPPPFPGKSANAIKSLEVHTIPFSVTIPYQQNASVIRILDAKGNVIDSTSTITVSASPASSEFYTITGDRFLNPSTDAAVSTPSGEFLDIAFIGDRYTADTLNVFHDDVNRMISTILQFDPFKSRALQLRFHYVDNTDSLGCRYVNDRVILCDDTLVIDHVNNAEVPYDKIYVIVNSVTYGGAYDWVIAAGYNGYWGGNVFVHEFGHELSELADEYLAYNWAPQFQNKNCYNGTPPNPAWAGIVAPDSYFIECNYPTYYRSSLSSIMREIDKPYFNAISIKLLNDSIDYYAGPFIPPTPTLTPTPTTMPVTILNGSFEADSNRDGMPDYWKIGFIDSGDKISSDSAQNGLFSFKFTATPSATKYIHQVLNGPFPAGKNFYASGWVKSTYATGTPSAGIRLSATVTFTDGTHANYALYFPKGSYDWISKSGQGALPKPAKKIDFLAVAGNGTGTVYFDNLMLTDTPNLLTANLSSLEQFSPVTDPGDSVFP